MTFSALRGKLWFPCCLQQILSATKINFQSWVESSETVRSFFFLLLLQPTSAEVGCKTSSVGRSCTFSSLTRGVWRVVAWLARLRISQISMHSSLFDMVHLTTECWRYHPLELNFCVCASIFFFFILSQISDCVYIRNIFISNSFTRLTYIWNMIKSGLWHFGSMWWLSLFCIYKYMYMRMEYIFLYMFAIECASVFSVSYIYTFNVMHISWARWSRQMQ